MSELQELRDKVSALAHDAELRDDAYFTQLKIRVSRAARTLKAALGLGLDEGPGGIDELAALAAERLKT